MDMPYLSTTVASDLFLVLYLCLAKLHGYMLGRYRGTVVLRWQGTLPVVLLRCRLILPIPRRIQPFVHVQSESSSILQCFRIT